MRHKIQHYEHYVVLGLVAALILFVAYLWWRRKKHTTLSEKTFEKIVDPAVEKLVQRHEERVQGSAVRGQENGQTAKPHTLNPEP